MGNDRKKDGKWSKLKNNFDCLGVIIGVLLVLAKNPGSLAVKL